MKILKSCLMLSLVFSLLFALPVSAASEKESSESKIDKKLKKVGYDDATLSKMPIGMKQELIRDGVTKFIGQTKKVMLVDDQGNFIGEKKEALPGEITALGTIPTYDLTLFASVAQLANASDGKPRFKIGTNFEWAGDTILNLTDKLGLSYSDLFQLDTDSNGNLSCAHGHRVDYPSKAYYWLDSCGGGPADLQYGGAVWNIDVRSGYFDTGYATMNIVSKTISGGRAQIITKYAHDTSLTYGIGVGIGPLALSYSSGASFDELAAPYSWYY